VLESRSPVATGSELGDILLILLIAMSVVMLVVAFMRR